jgi:hypothetical protein
VLPWQRLRKQFVRRKGKPSGAARREARKGAAARWRSLARENSETSETFARDANLTPKLACDEREKGKIRQFV